MIFHCHQSLIILSLPFLPLFLSPSPSSLYSSLPPSCPPSLPISPPPALPPSLYSSLPPSIPASLYPPSCPPSFPPSLYLPPYPPPCLPTSLQVRVGDVGGNTLGLYGGVFSPRGDFILAHGYQGAFHLWKKTGMDQSGGLELWQPIPTLSGHFGPVQDLSWEPGGGRFLLSVSSDQTARLHAPWKRGEHVVNCIPRPLLILSFTLLTPRILTSSEQVTQIPIIQKYFSLPINAKLKGWGCS